MLRLLVSRQYAYIVGETAVLPGFFFLLVFASPRLWHSHVCLSVYGM